MGDLAPCPKCGAMSRLAAIAGDCLTCTMGWTHDRKTASSEAVESRLGELRAQLVAVRAALTIERDELIAEVERLRTAAAEHAINENYTEAGQAILIAMAQERDELQTENQHLRGALRGLVNACDAYFPRALPEKFSTAYSVADKALRLRDSRDEWLVSEIERLKRVAANRAMSENYTEAGQTILIAMAEERDEFRIADSILRKIAAADGISISEGGVWFLGVGDDYWISVTLDESELAYLAALLAAAAVSTEPRHD